MNGVDLPRRLAAEALGTGLLVCTVVGSGIMADKLSDDVAVSLLGNTIPTGAILVVLITILGPLSGAHFNPAVTLAFLVRGEIAAQDVHQGALAVFNMGDNCNISNLHYLNLII